MRDRNVLSISFSIFYFLNYLFLLTYTFFQQQQQQQHTTTI